MSMNTPVIITQLEKSLTSKQKDEKVDGYEIHPF